MHEVAGAFVAGPISDEVRFVALECNHPIGLQFGLAARRIPNANFVDGALEHRGGTVLIFA